MSSSNSTDVIANGCREGEKNTQYHNLQRLTGIPKGMSEVLLAFTLLVMIVGKEVPLGALSIMHLVDTMKIRQVCRACSVTVSVIGMIVGKEIPLGALSTMHLVDTVKVRKVCCACSVTVSVIVNDCREGEKNKKSHAP